MTADQSRLVSRVSVVEALTQIRALCDEREHGPGPGWIPVDEVRAVLGAVSVDATPAHGIDRAELVALLLAALRGTLVPVLPLADRILALVRTVEFTVDPELLDRHAIELEARTRLPLGYARESLMRLVDVLIPAVRPVEGVVLTPEEAELAAPALRNAAARHAAASGAAWHVLAADLRALASRLEVS